MNRRSFFKWLTFGSLATAGGLFAVRGASAGNPYYDGPVSPNFDGEVFYNPNGTPPGGFADLVRWQLGGGKKAWPDHYPSPHERAKPVARVQGEDLRITMVGHATMLIQTQGLNFLTDPVWSQRVSPVSFAGPKRRNAPGVTFEDLPPIDVVLLTHNHYDHFDQATLARIVKTHDARIITPLGNDTIIRAFAPQARIDVGDWGDAFEIATGIKVHVEPCHHWSARGGSDRRMALWAAFVIETPGGHIYHIGDTGYHDGINYRAAAEKFGRFRFGLLPIGAYEPRWFMRGQHQNPAEAVAGFKAANIAHAMGHHWGTFRLTDEGVEEPIEALSAALEAAEIAPERFVPMRPGQIWDVPKTPGV